MQKLYVVHVKFLDWLTFQFSLWASSKAESHLSLFSSPLYYSFPPSWTRGTCCRGTYADSALSYHTCFMVNCSYFYSADWHSIFLLFSKMERTFIAIKPDGVQRGLVFTIAHLKSDWKAWWVGLLVAVYMVNLFYPPLQNGRVSIIWLWNLH